MLRRLVLLPVYQVLPHCIRRMRLIKLLHYRLQSGVAAAAGNGDRPGPKGHKVKCILLTRIIIFGI
jgi:hypothetical protein